MKKTKKVSAKKVESQNPKYVLDRTMHFGYLKQTFSIGTIFEVDFENKSASSEGVKFDDIRDVEICVRKGWLRPYSESEKEKIDAIAKSINVNVEKAFSKKIPAEMKVVKSDDDLMEREYKIENRFAKKPVDNSKPKSLDVLKETNTKTIRGIEVITQEDTQLARQLNAEIITSAKPLNSKVVTAKDSKSVEEKLVERKKLIEQNRKKTV